MEEKTVKTEHPAPWTYHIGQDYTDFYDAYDGLIMQVRYAMDEQTASIIAASPKLLEACEDVEARLCNALITVVDSDDADAMSGCLFAVRDAIAAAKVGTDPAQSREVSP